MRLSLSAAALTAFLALVTSPPAPGAGLALEDCFLDHIERPARCGNFTVPLDHDAPDSERIDLHVAVLKAIEEPGEPDPVVVLAGGPGQSAVAIAAAMHRTLEQLNRERDIVLMDQRGTGRSTPLACDLDFDALGFDPEAKIAAVRRCLETFPADPRHFTTRAHVRDLEAMRRALGYESVNLYGGSYGTRAGLVYLREHPEAIRTAVLDAVVPMDMRIGLEMGGDAQGALEALLTDCAEAPACRKAFPALGERLETLLAGLADEPRVIRYPDPATGEAREDEIGRPIVALAIRALLYSPQTRRALPAALAAAFDGDFLPLVGLATAANQELVEMMTPGLMLAVLCSEDLAAVSAEDVPARERESFVRMAQVEEFLAYCRAWPDPIAPMDWTPPASAVPTLLLSGGLDPVTPPYRAEAAAATLPESRHVVVPNGGHTVARLPCVAGIMTRFVESGGSAAPDTACVDAIPLPSFFTSLLGPAPGRAAP